MVTVLMVAEKPSLAESIAKILSNNHMKTRRGIATNVHEFNGTLFGKPAFFKMTSVMGHVYSLDFPKEYNNWTTVDPITLFEAPTIQLEANPKTHLIKHLRAESKGIDYLILWLDCDREGENICFEVMRNVLINIKPQQNKSKKDCVYRARFSAITAPDVKRAMANLVRPNENDAKAVDVRQELDLKIGCCFTRYQTRYFQGKYGNLDSQLISYGPCQIPTLALCVKRHDEIMSFKPVPYWTLYLTVNVNGTIVKATSTRGKIFDKNKVEGIKKSLKNLTEVKVYEITTDKKTVSRPHPLNTVELLRAASAGLGMSPQETMSVAERLYMQGYISYPRTETTKFPDNFDIHAVLQEHKNHSIWGSYVNDLLVNGFKKPEGGIDAGDHSPITPTRVATESSLGHNEWRLYELVTRTFIGSLLPNMKYLKTDVTFEIGYETFTCSGKQIIDPGFSSVMHWRSQQNENIPMIDKDSTYPVVEINSKESETTPPDYLSEADLLGLMEKYGIGTDASMAVHIASICNRNYVNVQGTRRSLIPTRLGIVLIHGYQKIDPELALPTMRADMEKRIGLIAEGKAQFDAVLQDEIELYRSKFEWFVKKITNMDELFEATFSPLSDSGRPFSKCGKCRRYMHLIALKPTRLHCRYCNDTYALPSNGSIKLYNEITCPYDNFEVISYSNGTKGKGYPLCPYCYNNSPIEGIESMSCNKCTNPNCQLSLQKNGMFECPEENCEGTMVLDNTLAPRYKIACNRCNLISCFNPEVHKVKLTDELCEECSGKKVYIEFIKKEGREPLKGCAICSDEINALLETKMDKVKHFNKRHKKYGKKGKKAKPKTTDAPVKEDTSEKSKPLYKRPETGYTLSLEALSSMGFTVDNISTSNRNTRESHGRNSRIENTRPSSNYNLFSTIQSKLDELSVKDSESPATTSNNSSTTDLQIKFVGNNNNNNTNKPTPASTNVSSSGNRNTKTNNVKGSSNSNNNSNNNNINNKNSGNKNNSNVPKNNNTNNNKNKNSNSSNNSINNNKMTNNKNTRNDSRGNTASKNNTGSSNTNNNKTGGNNKNNNNKSKSITSSITTTDGTNKKTTTTTTTTTSSGLKIKMVTKTTQPANPPTTTNKNSSKTANQRNNKNDSKPNYNNKSNYNNKNNNTNNNNNNNVSSTNNNTNSSNKFNNNNSGNNNNNKSNNSKPNTGNNNKVNANTKFNEKQSNKSTANTNNKFSNEKQGNKSNPPKNDNSKNKSNNNSNITKTNNNNSNNSTNNNNKNSNNTNNNYNNNGNRSNKNRANNNKNNNSNNNNYNDNSIDNNNNSNYNDNGDYNDNNNYNDNNDNNNGNNYNDNNDYNNYNDNNDNNDYSNNDNYNNYNNYNDNGNYNDYNNYNDYGDSNNNNNYNNGNYNNGNYNNGNYNNNNYNGNYNKNRPTSYNGNINNQPPPNYSRPNSFNGYMVNGMVPAVVVPSGMIPTPYLPNGMIPAAIPMGPPPPMGHPFGAYGAPPPQYYSGPPPPTPNNGRKRGGRGRGGYY